MPETLMILGASILQLPAIRKAREMGLQAVVADWNPNAVGFREAGIIREVISTIDTPAVLKVAERNHIDGIMTLASDMPMRTVAYVAEKLGLPGISRETALKTTNKAEMRNALRAAAVPVPLFFSVEDEEDFLTAVDTVRRSGFRCIVKPADNSGSRGVTLIDGGEAEALTAFACAKRFSSSGKVMVEEYMEGLELSVETLALDGVVNVIQVTDKVTTGAPHFVEVRHSQPSRLAPETLEEIRRTAIAANHAVGIANGPSHTEIKVTKDGAKIVELGARLGGDNITTALVPLSTGVDMLECCIHAALGRRPNLSARRESAAAIQYLQAGVGVIREVVGADEARRMDGVREVQILRGPGESVGEWTSSNDRPGFVITQADTASHAIEIAERAASLIRFRLA